MVDIYPINYTNPIGKVRKYIPDTVPLPDPADPTGPTSFIFSDEELQSFLDDETQGLEVKVYHIRRAAAWAMIALANNENLILKKIVTQDQQTDGPAVAKALVASAAQLFERANADQASDNTELFIDVQFGDYQYGNNNGDWVTYPVVW
jgi:hypothetical protein